MTGAIRVLDWKPLDPPRGSLRGFLRIEFPSGLIVNDVAIHAHSGKAWASPPGVPWVKNGVHLQDRKSGKPGYPPRSISSRMAFAGFGASKLSARCASPTPARCQPCRTTRP